MIILAVRLFEPIVADIDQRVVVEGFRYLKGVQAQNGLGKTAPGVEPAVLQYEFRRKIESPVIVRGLHFKDVVHAADVLSKLAFDGG